MMARLQILITIACISVLLSSCSQRAQARPGPAAFVLTEPIDTSASELQPLPAADHEVVKNINSSDVSVTRAESESETDSEEDEHELVCSEGGKCYEKRLLTADVDYKTDGPNNPITNPPH